MKRYLVLLLIFAIGFFAAGMGWGLWSKRKQEKDLAHSTPLRILCADGWLSNETLEKFSRAQNVRIQQWTYARPSEFLRQMANADGNVDVICTSSLLLKSLVHSHWLKKLDFASLANMKFLALDFSHLPYDPNSQYSVPVMWNLYGFLGKAPPPEPLTWKNIWRDKKPAFWGAELNVLQLMDRLGLNVEQRLQEEESPNSAKALEMDLRHFTQTTPRFIMPATGGAQGTAADWLEKSPWIEAPLARVADFLATHPDFKFWLPEDGATLEFGVLAVGEKSPNSALALTLINELISADEALAMHARMNSGVVQASLSGLVPIPVMQRSEALREFPLNRLQFPDLPVEALPRFQKIFNDSVMVK